MPAAIPASRLNRFFAKPLNAADNAGRLQHSQAAQELPSDDRAKRRARTELRTRPRAGARGAARAASVPPAFRALTGPGYRCRNFAACELRLADGMPRCRNDRRNAGLPLPWRQSWQWTDPRRASTWLIPPPQETQQ